MEELYEFTPPPASITVNGFKKDHHHPQKEDLTPANEVNNSLKFINFQPRRSSLRRKSSKIPTIYHTFQGRSSSLSYESSEMNDDANFEDVQNMTDKLKKLQEQIDILTKEQTQNEFKYCNMKKENLNLNNKITYLEEQIRDFEIQSDRRKTKEERRIKESLARIEIEKAQELENCVSRIHELQKELSEAKNELIRHKQTADGLLEVKYLLKGEIHDKELEIESLKDEIGKLKKSIRVQNEENHANSTLIEILNQELNDNIFMQQKLSQCEQHERESMNEELKNQLRMLKEENNALKDSNEELHAQLLNHRLIEGKSVLKEAEAISSLASEIGDFNINPPNEMKSSPNHRLIEGKSFLRKEEVKSSLSSEINDLNIDQIKSSSNRKAIACKECVYTKFKVNFNFSLFKNLFVIIVLLIFIWKLTQTSYPEVHFQDRIVPFYSIQEILIDFLSSFCL